MCECGSTELRRLRVFELVAERFVVLCVGCGLITAHVPADADDLLVA